MTVSLQFVGEYQTLISGILAILAAVGTIWAIVHTARLPLKAQEEERQKMQAQRRRYVCLVLGRDLNTLAARARSAEGTIKVTIAANVTITDETKAKIVLRVPDIVSDWASMSLLPEQTLMNLFRVIRKVEDHNFDMQRAGGSFGADNFRDHILNQIQQIQTSAHAVGSQIDMLRAEGRSGVHPQQFPAD